MPRAIGLFDSGVGGLTVAGEVFRRLPGLPVIYFGDTAHVPYGGRSAAELIRFADRIISFLTGQGAGYIIFACNTSSAVSLDAMRDRYAVPMVGLIGPGSAAAAAATRNGRVGVIATEATVASGAYEQAIRSVAPEIVVCSRPAPKLVPLVESSVLDGPNAENALREYLLPLKAQGIDTLVLGCTHYPFLTPVISRVLGPDVILVDPAEATVATARRELVSLGYSPAQPHPVNDWHRYYVSADAAGFRSTARYFLGENMPIDVREVSL